LYFRKKVFSFVPAIVIATMKTRRAMKYEVYKDIQSTNDYSLFSFVSTGRHGNIRKGIEFTPTQIPGFVNLAFGDIDAHGYIDDCRTSANGDRNKVLATIAHVVDMYLTRYPETWIYFKGSTIERTRLYRMAICLNLEELSLKFIIYTEQKGGIIPFRKNVEALSFFVKKNSLN
jgi:hypothetical protein